MSNSQLLKLHSQISRSAFVKPDDVKEVKAFLEGQGLYNKGVDDYPDRDFFTGIESFQERQGLQIDGVMRPGGETEQAINSVQMGGQRARYCSLADLPGPIIGSRWSCTDPSRAMNGAGDVFFCQIENGVPKWHNANTKGSKQEYKCKHRAKG